MAPDIDALNLGLLLLRVVTGVTFALHGWFKFFKGGRIPGTGLWFDSIGMKPGKVHAYAAATTETVSGLGLALGLLTPLCGAGMVGVMFVAAWTVNRPNGFFSANHGWEFNLTLALIGVVVATLGPFEWSVDHALGIADDLDGYAGLLIALVGGLAAGIGQVAIFFRPPPPEPSAS